MKNAKVDKRKTKNIVLSQGTFEYLITFKDPPFCFYKKKSKEKNCFAYLGKDKEV